MNYLLDTCIISELTKPKPYAKVVKWLRSCQEENLFLCSLTIGEIQKGISKLPNSRKKAILRDWVGTEFIRRFGKRILAIDYIVAQQWGKTQALSEKVGIKIPVIDCLITNNTSITHFLS